MTEKATRGGMLRTQCDQRPGWLSRGSLLAGDMLPTGNPLMIELDGLKPTSTRYLDEDRAQPLSFAD